MSLKERFTKWWDFTRRTMRGMSFSQKLGYILRYYKGWILGIFVLLLFIGYIGDAVTQAHKEVYIQGFFTNDDYGLFDAERLEKDYSSLLPLTKNQIVVFDDDLYIDLGGGATDYTAASNGKLIAYMATQQLDFVVTSEEVLHHYESETPMLGFDELLPEELFDELSPYLYSYTNAENETKLIALDMSESRFLKGRSDIDETYYLFVPYLAPNREHIVEFIRWCFE